MAQDNAPGCSVLPLVAGRRITTAVSKSTAVKYKLLQFCPTYYYISEENTVLFTVLY